MDPIEKAIRNAFEKGNADDRAFREKVYRSAFAALDRALQANPGVTVEAAINRRKAMQAKIAEIESEFLPAVDSAPPAPGADDAAPAVDIGGQRSEDASSTPAPAVEVSGAGSGEVPSIEMPPVGGASASPSVETGRPQGKGDRVEPEFSPQQASGAAAARARVEPSVADITPAPALAGSAPSEAAANVAPDRDERRARRRFPTGLVVGVLLLAAIAAGAWWAVQSGLFRLPGEIGSSRPAGEDGDQATAPAEGTLQKPGEADQRNWITVFAPNDPTHVNAPSDAKAEVMQDDSGSFLRVRSGSSGSAVSFDVGQGVLEQLAGKHAVFDIVARAEEGKDTQMSIDCNFGELGDCGRKRYAVGHEKNEYLFDVDFPDKRPGAAGAIAVNSDFDGQGKSVDIYEIRVSVVE
ncbi:hypothetical protein [Ollibium composti]|uniref:Uncharacterized protein n=1 Tax=Ollibium composti TaxID=2675109 RepID=A0ABY2Q4L7_9HYPH|nr:hypothetical protein [Mesorhizobium composti]THF56272.1 hypothetical protein E6C48_14045 [Mesorhizobium composti]